MLKGWQRQPLNSGLLVFAEVIGPAERLVSFPVTGSGLKILKSFVIKRMTSSTLGQQATRMFTSTTQQN